MDCESLLDSPRRRAHRWQSASRIFLFGLGSQPRSRKGLHLGDFSWFAAASAVSADAPVTEECFGKVRLALEHAAVAPCSSRVDDRDFHRINGARDLRQATASGKGRHANLDGDDGPAGRNVQAGVIHILSAAGKPQARGRAAASRARRPGNGDWSGCWPPVPGRPSWRTRADHAGRSASAPVVRGK